jgi:TRAP transporter 4TM/12TM fusion protein
MEAKKKYISKVELLGQVLIAFIAVSMSLFHLTLSYFGPPELFAFRSTHLCFVLILTFIIYPPVKKRGSKSIFWFRLTDLIIILFIIFVQLYVILYDLVEFNEKSGFLTKYDILIGCIYLIIVFEATRRAVGWGMLLTALFFTFNTIWTEYFPGFLYGPPTSLINFVDAQFYQEIGIFGIPIAVMSSYIVLFIIFGSMLLRSGASQFLVELSYALTGWQRGGPAKVAVVSSSMMGTVSGSAVANVVTTGTFTIPMMKKIGYTPNFSGAVEAVSSSGGQLMPPIMGAAAFIMAEFLGVSYLTVVIAGILPAVLYYFSLFLIVHFEAIKLGMKPMKRVDLPKVKDVLKKRGHLLIPLFVIMFTLVSGYTVMRAGFNGIASLFILSFIKKDTRFTPLTMLEALKNGAVTAIPVSVACASAGVVIGAITISGSGARFSSLVISFSGEYLWIALITTMVISFILGMGLTTSADYIILASLVIPALIKLGVTPLAAHFFGFYFSSVSGITPPVALAAFAAAGISHGNMMKTGLLACKVGIAAFIVPYMFVYEPSILIIGSNLFDIVIVLITALFGIFCLVCGIQGWLFYKANILERLLLITASITLIKAGVYADLMGVILFGIAVLTNRMKVFTSIFEYISRYFLSIRKTLIKEKEPQTDTYIEAEVNMELPKSNITFHFTDLQAPSIIGERKMVGWASFGIILILLTYLGFNHYHVKYFNQFIIIILAVSLFINCTNYKGWKSIMLET